MTIPERGKALARTLVKEGLLTKFQAALLLIGRNSGFILGQYRILDQLGQGGMGRVFKAQHVTMGRTVALKVLAPRHTKTEKARKLFMREVRAVAKMTHQNIVTAHDANDVDGRHYLVMEYIDGPNLDQLVRDGGPLPVGLACDIICQAATGLQYAHEQGMVHRDIKPSNLLLHSAGTTLSSGYIVKILDFGLAKFHHTVEPADPALHSPKNVIFGTPDFLSPEQARNLPGLDIRSDLYSLGCTFYFLMTGQAPFPGGSTLEKLVRHTNAEPVAIEQLRPDIPQEVADIIRCMMAKEPAHRFQTPAQLVQELMPLAAPLPNAWAAVKSKPVVNDDDSNPTTDEAAAVVEDKQSALTAVLPEDTVSLSEIDLLPLPPVQRRGKKHWFILVFGILAGGLIGAALTAWLLLLWL
ncbi:MAG TPA: serine/threonine-protein kinase, partial [Gemmataceae bacterium]|nr:serine/threonine-protein kinase [Gemmataceae bacterium]